MLMMAKMAAMLAAGEGGGAPADPLAFVSASTASRSSGTGNITVAAPSSIANGNTLYLIVFGASWSTAAATCSGFTLVSHDNADYGGVTILKRTAAGESGSYSVASSTDGAVDVHMLNYSGGLGTQDVVGAVNRDESETGTGTAPSVTATAAGALVAAFFILDAATVSTPPSGMTQRSSNTSGSYRSYIYDLNPSAPGATGSKSIVWSTGNWVVSFQMQIK